MGSLRRLLEWLRDLDARYGYVKRARVMPGDPAPVRLRKVADTSAVVLVQPPAPTYAPPAPHPLAPPPYVDADEDRPIPVAATPSAEEVDAELEELEADDEPADPPRGWAEPEGEDDEADDGESEDDEPEDEYDAEDDEPGTAYADVEDELEAEEESELEDELAEADPDGAEPDEPTSVLAPIADDEGPISPLVPNPDAVNRLRGHRPD